ncbi:hypothetical protein ACX8XN_18545 [Calditrichota bacterium GD2]
MSEDAFYQAYLDCREGKYNNFLFILEREIVRPFVRKSYYFLHNWLEEIEKVTFLTPEIEDTLVKEVLTELFIILHRSRFFERFGVEGNGKILRSYLSRILKNEVNLDRYSYTRHRFTRTLDQERETFHFWSDGLKKRATDANITHEKRNYYLACWSEIPDLLQGRIADRFTLADFDGNRLLAKLFKDRIAEFCINVFEKILFSLKIKHFLEFLSKEGFFNSEEQNDDKTDNVKDLADMENTDPIREKEEMEFFRHLVQVLQKEVPRSLQPVILWARSVVEHLQQPEANKRDHFRHASQLSGGKFSRNTIEYHIKDERNQKNFMRLFEREFEKWFPNSDPGSTFLNFLHYLTQGHARETMEPK